MTARRVLRLSVEQAEACKAWVRIGPLDASPYTGDIRGAKPAAAPRLAPSGKPATRLKARKPPRALSEAEERFAVQLRAGGIKFEREVRFNVIRKWRLDFSVWGGETLLAVEIQGRGRHQTWTGFAADCEKLSHAAIAGYRVILATPAQVKSGQALQWTKAALGL